METATTFALDVYRHVFWGIDQHLGSTFDENRADLLSNIGDGRYVRHPDFRIDDTFVQRLVAELNRLTVTALSLAGCRQITASGVAAVTELDGLRFLDLFNTELADDDLAQLSTCHDLEVLNLAGTAVRGPVLDILAGLPKLHTVHLGFTDLARGAVATLARFPVIRTVDLMATPTSDEDVDVFAQCGSLVELGLEETYVSDAAVSALKPLADQLTRLHLGYTAVTDDCVGDLCGFGALRHLQLRATHVDRKHGETLSSSIAALNERDESGSLGLVW